MPESGASGLILASSSPYRRQMLERAGVSFAVVAADVDEAALKLGLMAAPAKPGPAGIAKALAEAKAKAVSGRRPGALVIGADQTLALGMELFDKPGDPAEARAQLERLRGNTHQLHTAAALAQDGQIVWTCIKHATLSMRPFSAQFLDGYLAQFGGGLCRIVGAYEIEGAGIQLFDRVDGDHFTIVGLPLVPLLSELRARGVIPT